MEAPMTDEGVCYVYHKTDQRYKKIKFTDPESLTRAFGEYAAGAVEAGQEQRNCMLFPGRSLPVPAFQIILRTIMSRGSAFYLRITAIRRYEARCR